MIQKVKAVVTTRIETEFIFELDVDNWDEEYKKAVQKIRSLEFGDHKTLPEYKYSSVQPGALYLELLRRQDA